MSAKEAAAALLVESLRARSSELRQAGWKARNAYTRGPLYDASQELADTYERAAEVLERKLAELRQRGVT